ncbi:MAG: hypothetical protein D6719_03585 [Candidatus Dadabacteria bacterium]|nr:MAG: hypothetical protein D6719_03585 [Candidatus Dadabacteria bacterium]
MKKLSKTARTAVRLLFTGCLILLGLDLALLGHDTHFIYESRHFFYACFGFCSGLIIVLLAKHVLRPIVKRSEDYYE